MKTLLINGSPRKNGGTAYLVHALREKLTGGLLEIDTYDTAISPCRDFRHCCLSGFCASWALSIRTVSISPAPIRRIRLIRKTVRTSRRPLTDWPPL